MSWRRFLVLCKNLSPYGAVASAIRAAEEDRRDGRGEPSEKNEARDRIAAQDLFTSIVSV